MVIGAGLAGAAVASRLAVRGWRIDLIEREDHPSGAASGLVAGVYQPHVSRDDNLLSRFTRAGFLYAQRAWPAALASNAAPPWQSRGVLQLADGPDNEARVAETSLVLGLPLDYARFVERDEASALAGARLAIGGWWFPAAGFVRPAAIVRSQLDDAARRGAGIAQHFGRAVAYLGRDSERWIARDATGATLAAAPVAVLANAHDAAALVDLGGAFARIRGQQSYLPTPPFHAPRVVVGGDGYVLPARDGIAVVGATYDLGRDDPHPDAASHRVNLARAEHMLPGSAGGVDAATLAGGVAFRSVATDRLPLVGAVPDVARARAEATTLTGAQLGDLPRVHGLYAALAFASRGLAWTLLAAEALASEIEGEPAPLSRALCAAIDPGRFALERLRHGAL